MSAQRRPSGLSVKHMVDEFFAEHPVPRGGDKKAVYQAALRFAEERLGSDPRCNAFLVLVARRLDQEPLYLPWVTNRHPIPETAYLSAAWTDQGVQMVGNREGLRYLARLAEALADSLAEADHIHAETSYEMIPGSENMTLILETNAWFRENWGKTSEDAQPMEAPPLPRRDIDESRIAGVLLTDYIPDIVGLSADRIFPVLAVLPYEEGDSVWRKGVDNASPDRYRILKLEALDHSTFDLCVNLDDETVAFLYKEDLERAYRLIFEKH